MKKRILCIIYILLFISSSLFASYYYQSKLSKKENEIYVDIVKKIIIENKREIKINKNISEKELSKIYDAIYKDLPQLFFLEDGIQFNMIENNLGQKKIISINFTDKKFDNSIYIERKKVQQKVNDISNIINKLETSYEKILTLYKFFAQSRKYDISLLEDQSCYSALINKSGVCASWARAFQYIMYNCGINCIYVTGMVNNQPHGWNMVEIGNSWYHVDVTNANSQIEGFFDFQYFLIPTYQMEKIAVIDDKENIPTANLDNYNYYKINNLYIPKYSKQNIEKIIKDNYKIESNFITLSFVNNFDLKKAKIDLIDNQLIYKIIDVNSIKYNINEERHLLTLIYK